MLIKKTGEEQDLKAEQAKRNHKLKEPMKSETDSVESDDHSKTDDGVKHDLKEIQRTETSVKTSVTETSVTESRAIRKFWRLYAMIICNERLSYRKKLSSTSHPENFVPRKCSLIM